MVCGIGSDPLVEVIVLAPLKVRVPPPPSPTVKYTGMVVALPPEVGVIVIEPLGGLLERLRASAVTNSVTLLPLDTASPLFDTESQLFVGENETVKLTGAALVVVRLIRPTTSNPVLDEMLKGLGEAVIRPF